MNASSNSPKKIARIRTFAQDAEKHANQSIDEVRATHKTKDTASSDTNNKTDADTLNLDTVDTETVTEKDIASVPSKQDTKNYQSDSETESAETIDHPNADAEVDQETNISNPPFHKLATERKKVIENLGASTETISDHPESLLSSEKKQTVSVDDDEATSGATIVTDTKSGRKSVLEDIGDSITSWFNKVKNTYITPPKPSYTVSKSERRAGILEDATAQTGTALVDHDSFAARIRERYHNAATTDQAMTTEPAWLPSLPASDRRDVNDVQTVPRKSVQTQTSPESVPPQKNSNTTEKPAPSLSEVDESTQTTKDERADTPSTNVPENSKDAAEKTTNTTKAERTSKVSSIPPTSIPDQADSASPLNTPAPATPTDTTTTPTPQGTDDKPTDQDNTRPTTSIPKTQSTADSNPEREDLDPSQPTADGPANNGPQQTNSTTPQNTPAPATPEPANTQADSTLTAEPNDVASSELPSDQEPDEDAMLAAQQATNRLSVGIVLGTTVAVIAGAVVYSIAPLFLNQADEPEPVVSTAFGDEVRRVSLTDWNNQLARTQAVREAMNTEITDLQYIALEVDGEPVTDPRELASLLNFTIPTAVQANVQAFYTGNYQGTAFFYLHAPDTTQILGAFLAWENNLTQDLQMILPTTTHSGQFVDIMINDTYDARVKIANNDEATLTYTIVGDHVLITTTPEAAAQIIEAL